MHVGLLSCSTHSILWISQLFSTDSDVFAVRSCGVPWSTLDGHQTKACRQSILKLCDCCDGGQKKIEKSFSRFTKQSLYIRIVVVVNAGPSLWKTRFKLEKSSTYRRYKAVQHWRVELAGKLDKDFADLKFARFCTKQTCGYQ